MSVQEAIEYADLINKLVASIAILGAGAWALWTFVLRREGVWNLQLTISPTDLPYGPGFRLLLIRVDLKNVGKVKITPGSKGCRVSVRKLPKDARAGEVLERDRGELLVEDVDILEHYRENGGYAGYEIEPGCEYHELMTVIVPEGDILVIKGRFWWKENSDAITEHCVTRVGKT